MFIRTPGFIRTLTGATIISALALALMLIVGSLSIARGDPLGDPARGKQAWESAPLNFVCARCHGTAGQGAFGPDLAGRTLTVAQWTRQIRQPYGLMPAFPATTISDETIDDVAAYMASLPTVATPGAPAVVTSPGDTVGKQLVIEKGCAQCHGLTVGGPRAGLGEQGLTRADVINQIRTAFFYPKFNKRPATMPTFTEKKISADDATRIADYLFTLGPRVRLNVGTTAKRDGNVITYTITATSRAQTGGMDASHLFVAGSVPAGATFLRAGATPANSFFRGFEGVGTANQAAVWLIERIPPGATYTYTYEVQVAPSAPAAAHGFIRQLGPSEETIITGDAAP